MSAERNPLTQRYLEQLGAALERTLMHQDERDEILGEIDNHLAEAARSGVLLPDALETLGSAENLARAYAVELTLNPRTADETSAQQKVLAALTRASAMLAALLLVVVMGGLGVGLAVAGGVAVVAGFVAPFLPSAWLDPTLRAGLPQLVVVLGGAVLLGVGIVSIRLVHLNARFVLGALRSERKDDSR